MPFFHILQESSSNYQKVYASFDGLFEHYKKICLEFGVGGS